MGTSSRRARPSRAGEGRTRPETADRVAGTQDRPVARVVIDVLPAHLDRPFDYAVPAEMSDDAMPGVRVRVRFAGKDVDGFLLERLARSDHDGPLTPLRRVVSPEPVLTPEVIRLARGVADRYAGTLNDVLRLAVPPRHATVEGAQPSPRSVSERDFHPRNGGTPHPDRDHGGAGAAPGRDPGPWADYPAGPAFLARLRRGQAPRAAWAALPGPRHWAEAIVEAAAAVLDAGRGVVVVLPDRRDVDTLESAVLARLGPDRHARLEADLGAASRYQAFLSCLRGRVRLAIGTRSAAFAPVADLGLVVVWDDADDSHAEPRAPYPHSRDVLVLRAEQSGAAMLLAGWSVSVESALLLGTGWARRIQAERAVRRERWPRVITAEDAAGPDAPYDPARGAGVPAGAWRALRRSLVHGPVLIQVPRAGYLPAVACAGCRRSARCPHCAGPVQLARDGAIACGWCARSLTGWACPHCGHSALRAVRVGVQRTAEELGRAFPGVPVVLSRPDRDLPRVTSRPTIVLATAGIEPPVLPVGAGDAAAVLLDGDAVLARADLRAGEEALRRWLAAAALVRPAPVGGLVVVCAEPSAPAVQALVRLDPAGFAEYELAQREELRLPPAWATAGLVGDPAAVAQLLRVAELPTGVEVLGPTQLSRPEPDPGALVDEGFALDPAPVRILLRVARPRGAALAGALHAAAAVRSARKDKGAVRIQVDPRDIG